MDHGGEAARSTTTVGSTELGMLGVGAVGGSEANIGSVMPVAAEFHRHHDLGGGGVVYPASWPQLGPVGVGLVGPQLRDGVVRVHDNDGYPRPGARRGVMLLHLLPDGGGDAGYDGYYPLLPRPGAGHGEVLGHLLPNGAGHGDVFAGLLPSGGGGGAAYDDYRYYALQPRPGARHGEVLVDMFPDGAGHGDVFVGLLPSGGVAVHGDYGYYVSLPSPGAGRRELHVYLLPDGAGHGDVFVGLLPSGGVAVHGDYGYYVSLPRPGAGRRELHVYLLPDGAGHGEVLVCLLPGSAWLPRPDDGRGEVLPDGVGVVFDGSGNFAWQTLQDPGTRGADGISGALRGPNLGERYEYDNRGVVAEQLRRLLPFAGIAALSVAINGLVAGPGSPAAAFDLFVVLLGGLFLVILHVLSA